MKKHKGRILVLFLAVLLVSVLSCKNPFLKKMLVEEESASPAVPVPKHTVSFSVEGGLGTLKAKADGIAETDVSPITVEQGKTVTFTATPEADYEVEKWELNGTAVNGTAGTYELTVTEAVNVKVFFTPIPGEGDVGSFEDAGDFVKIIPPANGITGVEPAYPLPETEDWWKGVFIAGRKVKLSPYKLGKTEVTYKLWKEVYDWAVKPENGYKFANAGRKGSSGTGSEDEPVTVVSWRDCIVWCNAYTHKTNNAESECVYRKSKTDSTVLKDATAKEGEEYICDAAYADMNKKGFRLPTEAEWEYAARWQGSNSTNAAQYGEVWLTKLNSASGAKDKWDTAETGEVAWYKGNSGNTTHPVGQKRANALGLHDMSGNVWEWCWDRYGSIEPGDVTDPADAALGSLRILRGGSWRDSAKYCAVGSRGSGRPDDGDSDRGFRLAWRP